MKKLMTIVLALVLGALSAGAKDLASLGIYYSGEGSVELVGKPPKGVYVGKPQKSKNGWTSFPCHIVIDKPASVELKFKVTGDVNFYASLYAFSKGTPGEHRIIPVMCRKFEVNGVSVSGVPGVVKKWRRMFSNMPIDGDVITIALELEKQEE